MPTIKQIMDDAKTRYRHTYDPEVILGWLETAHVELWKKVPRNTLPAPITLNGSGVYALPAGVRPRHIKAVTMGPSTGPFVPIAYKDARELIDDGYSLTDTTIAVIEPEPKVGVTNYLFIYYDKTIPSPLTTADIEVDKPELPEEWHEALTVALLEKIAAARKDIKMKNNYAAELQGMLGDYLMESIDHDPEYPSCRDELPRRARYGSSVDD